MTTRLTILVPLLLTWIFSAALTPADARADDAIFPPGSRLGLTPAKGLKAATAFPGFEDDSGKVKVIAAELPPAAFGQIEAAMRSEAKAGTGTARDKPEMFSTAGGFGLLTRETAKDGGAPVERWGLAMEAEGFTALVTVQMPQSARKQFPAETIRTMLASVSIRESVPVAEQMARLPFRLNDLADFKTMRTIVPGAAVLLTDSGPGAPDKPEPYMILSAMPGGVARAEDRPRFAEQAVYGIQGINSVRISSSEPLRMGQQQGFETRFTAKDNASGEDLTMVQWLRFGNSGFLLIIAAAPNSQWPDAFPRFRRVRDGIERP